MKAVRVLDGTPTLVDADTPAPGRTGNQVRVNVAAVGICGSDLHLLDLGFAEGRVLGHEISGHLDDGTAVAIEPFRSCGACGPCENGDRHRCDETKDIIGIASDGGMAEHLLVPDDALVPLAPGVDIGDASLVENLAVAVHALNRARLEPRDRVAVVGAGPIGLATAAALRRSGFAVSIAARHDHQRAAAGRIGAHVIDDADGQEGDFDVVFDAVGNTASLGESVRRVAYQGRIVMVGSFWDQVGIDVGILMQEAELIPAMMYGRTPNGREIDGAARLLAELPELGSTLITHRFPLDAAPEAFAVAGDRAAGAIKVVLEPGR
ncbi:MAG: alcohol dehydrogenase catalytic domain-containing protein [Acidimicrobiales bacterium]|nr:alcohol dehydrogenase catalytic domain-containing protein [Acidimicrobiales bacterium]